MRGTVRVVDGAAAEWPVSLQSADGRTPDVLLRPLRRSDRSEWERLRAANLDWVLPWEPTMPSGRPVRMNHRQYVRHLDSEARSGRSVPFAIEVEGAISGQIHLSAIQRSSLQSGSVGYWVARHIAGTGVATRCLAMVSDYAFCELGLHRIEVNIRPENERSLAVVRHLRFREEGVRHRFLHIDGGWRDHVSFALTVEDVGRAPVISRWTRGEIGARDG